MSVSLFGLRNGWWSVRHTKRWFETVVCHRVPFNACSSIIYQEHLSLRSDTSSKPIYWLTEHTFLTIYVWSFIGDHDIRFTQLYRLTDEERYLEVKEDLENIKTLGIELISITCDGHRALLKAIKKVFPQVLLQRCVVHVVRQCKTWLTQHPQSFAAMEFLTLVKQLHLIKTLQQSGLWLAALWHREKKHKSFIDEKVFKENGRYWYKHKMLRKARYLLHKSIPNLFHYLDNPAVPRTTNRLESFFSHLKDKLRVHRGLTIRHRRNFIQWYLFFQNQKQEWVSISHKNSWSILPIKIKALDFSRAFDHFSR